MRTIGNCVRTYTDERMILDFELPGVNAEAVSVMVRPNKFVDPDFPERTFGRDIVVRVDPAKVNKPDEYGVYKWVGDAVKQSVAVPGDFDISRTAYTFINGILRISVPKIDEWKGVVIQANGGTPAPAQE